MGAWAGLGLNFSRLDSKCLTFYWVGGDEFAFAINLFS